MPIYEYKCDTCETRFEKLVRGSDDADNLSCPSCGKRHLSQEYSTFSARANGAGQQQPRRRRAPAACAARPACAE